MNLDLLKKIEPLFVFMRRYHRHKVVGIKNIPATGPCLIVLSHSLATYDMGLLFHAIYEQTGRIARPLIDRLFYKIPYLGEFFESLGSREGGHGNAQRLLQEGNIVAVAPGGMREALRPNTKKYQIDWKGRRGFVKLAVEAQVPIILAACPSADDLYEMYDLPITKWIYERWRVPVFFALGFGLSPLPRPIQLTHYLSKPVTPPAVGPKDENFAAEVDKFHQLLEQEMQQLMKKVKS